MRARLAPEHLLELVFVSDPEITTDGRFAAAVHTRIETASGGGEAPRYRGSIVVHELEARWQRTFTSPSYSASRPRFSPSGDDLAFLAQYDDGRPQLHVMPVAGGESAALTELKSGVTDFAWHPSGNHIAFVSRGDVAPDEGSAAPRAITHLTYKRDGVGLLSDQPAQLYLVAAEGGAPAQLSRLKADPKEPVFSPDGRTLYFAAAKDRSAVDAWRSNIWALPVDVEKPERTGARQLARNIRMASSPSVSPDGSLIAFFGPCDKDNFATPTGVWLVSSKGGRASLVTDEEDVLPSIAGDSRYGNYRNVAVWAEDSRAVFVNINRRGRSVISRVGVDGRIEAGRLQDAAIVGFRHAAQRFVYVKETPLRPGELYLEDASGSTQLSDANGAFLARHTWSQASSERTATSSDGTQIPYWVLPPQQPRQDAALVLQVHGGPHINYGYGFFFEFQLLAAAGYTVVYGNPRGGSSYGRDFALAVQRDYGGLDALDVTAIWQDALNRHDSARAPVHLTGGSYGGFMTNWLVAHTGAFASAVTQRSICNWLSFYGTADIGYRFMEVEHGEAPWQDFGRLWDRSPLKYAERVATPILIIHAEQDHRCPVEQAEQWYIALKRIGKASTCLLRFPDEGHELSRSGRPDRRIERLKAIIDWFERHPVVSPKPAHRAG